MISIDDLLETCLQGGGSDIHLVVGQPPVMRKNGRMRKIAGEVLGPEDTRDAMKTIAPESHQRELQERGGTEFLCGFRARSHFRVSASLQRENVSLVLRLISDDADDSEQSA